MRFSLMSVWLNQKLLKSFKSLNALEDDLDLSKWQSCRYEKTTSSVKAQT